MMSEIKKPERKIILSELPLSTENSGHSEVYGDEWKLYNQACDDWEQYIKSKVVSVEEMSRKIEARLRTKHIREVNSCPNIWELSKSVAQSIHTLITERLK